MNNNKYSNLDRIAYTQNTLNKIEYWNPFEDRKDIQFFENKKAYYILGPINNEDIKYFWNFHIRLNNNELLLSTMGKNKNFNQCITITIKDNVGRINYLNDYYDHRGKDLVGWLIQIIKQLGCEKCILQEIEDDLSYANFPDCEEACNTGIQDVAEINCNKQNSNNYIPLSLIHKLWLGHTYYEDFGFIPYDKNNNAYLQDKLLELNNKIKNLQEIKWDYFDIHDKKWIEFKNKYSHLYPSPFCAFREFTPDKCNIFYDILFFIDNLDLLNDICNIISKNIWMKII